MEKIVVASTNPVKISAALDGFKKMFPKKEFQIEGVKVSSEVSDQPISEEETYQGALNRVNNAKKVQPDSDYWIGLEGGIQEVNDGLRAFAFIVIESKEGVIGTSRTADFLLPYRIAELIKQGKELGEADDIVFGRNNSRQTNGAVGILTNDVITRSTYYEQAVILALIPLINKELYLN